MSEKTKREMGEGDDTGNGQDVGELQHLEEGYIVIACYRQGRQRLALLQKLDSHVTHVRRFRQCTAH